MILKFKLEFPSCQRGESYIHSQGGAEANKYVRIYIEDDQHEYFGLLLVINRYSRLHRIYMHHNTAYRHRPYDDANAIDAMPSEEHSYVMAPLDFWTNSDAPKVLYRKLDDDKVQI